MPLHDAGGGIRLPDLPDPDEAVFPQFRGAAGPDRPHGPGPLPGRSGPQKRIVKPFDSPRSRNREADLKEASEG